MPSSPTAISLFSGLGGLDWGARIAGAEVEVATDVDAEALALLRLAQGTNVAAGDVWDVIPTLGSSRGRRDDVQIILGGPPCTAFSHAGFWLEGKRNGTDPAAGLLEAYVEAVKVIQPDAFVMENVPGLRFRNFRGFYDSVVNRLRRAGYSVSAEILNASDFGVPQSRRRLFIVGSKGGPRIDLSKVPKRASRSSGWAIADLEQATAAEPDERPNGVHSRWLDAVPPGENYLALTAERGHPDAPFEYRSRYWSFLLKLHPDEPAPTIPAQRVTYNGPFHWTGRHLRLRELARLQTFPDEQTLDGDLKSARRHIGNAVPPLLAAAVMRYVLEALDMVDGEEPEALRLAGDPSATFAEVTSAYPLRSPAPPTG